MKIKSEFNYVTTFPPLGHPEHHFNKYPNHPWLKSKEEIIQWLDTHIIFLATIDNPYIIHDDLTVSYNESQDISHLELFTHFPLQIRSCKGVYMDNNFDNKSSLSLLKSLIGTPYNCKWINFNNHNIDSFIGLSPNISRSVYLNNNNINSFIEIPPSFNHEISLYLSDNPIESWEHFPSSHISNLSILKSNVSKFERIFNFLIQAPLNIEHIQLATKNRKQIETVFVLDDGDLDMKHFRELQIIHHTSQNAKLISDSISSNDFNSIRKRKI